MQKVAVLGAGMVGSAMAWDMGRQGFDVTVIDARDEALARVASFANVATRRADLSDPATLAAEVAPFDLVLGALSSAMGFATLRTILATRKPYVDISFMGEDAWALDGLAKELGAMAIVDCGVGPGMSNMICGYAAARMSPCERIDILVGGLPRVRRWPYEYKAPFAPSDVIEEYLRPARIVENGRLVVKEALSEPELVTFEGLGTLEAFNTDGLRSLSATLSVPNMRERTMRYPGHIALMRVLRETGFFSSEPVLVGGALVRPVELTSKVLFPHWTFEEGEEDLTVMRIEVTGLEDGRRVRRTWDLFDRRDPETGIRSMSRTTGFPATVVAGLVAEGAFREPGVHPPEVLGRVPGLLDRVFAELAKRGIHFVSRVEPLA
jgi:saccharopine dehydrogenase-like NADP-dependent oxidoreductase